MLGKMELKSENIDLDHFTNQLRIMEKLLEKASDHNQAVVRQIEKMKNIVNCNQGLFEKMWANDKNLATQPQGDVLNEAINSNMKRHAFNIQEKLTITTALFEDFKNQQNEKGKSDFRLSQQLSGLGATLIAIGDEMLQMRQDNAAMESEADALYMRSSREASKSKVNHRASPTHIRIQAGDVHNTKRKEKRVEQSLVSVCELRSHSKIINKIKTLMGRIDQLNLNTEIRANVKMLARMVLHSLIERSVNKTSFSNTNLENEAIKMSKSIGSTSSRKNPYLNEIAYNM